MNDFLSLPLLAPWALGTSASETDIGITATGAPALSGAPTDADSKHVSPSGSSNLDSPTDALFGLAPLSTDLPANPADANPALENAQDEGDEILPEMMYVTDEVGNILSLKDPGTWNKWLSKNCPTVEKDRLGKSLCPWLVGRNLFEYIDDEKVAAFSRHILYMLGTSQQDSFNFWFCDTPTLERKMLMNVSSHQAFNDSKLIVWASRIIYERPLLVLETWLEQEWVPYNEAINRSPSASSKSQTPSSRTDSAGTPVDANTPSVAASGPARSASASASSANVTLHNSSVHPNTMGKTNHGKCKPTRNVCSYCKRIMVIADDLDPKIVTAITESSNTLPASVIYDGPIPFLGGRARNGLQPLPNSPSGSSATGSDSNDSTAAASSSSSTLSTTTPAQLSVQGVITHLWLSPHQYYNVAKLTDNVTIYSGVCEVCYAEIGFLFFKKGTFANGMRIVEESGAEKVRLETAEKAVEMEKLMVKGPNRGVKRGAAAELEKKVRVLAPKPGMVTSGAPIS
ncbi:hypothetical protein HDU98_000549 [Podochytrium sp. JEL0797]|nr:hypothetical protein HDU98_000549 [Podochytrium sp. JEL0797]